MLSFHLLNKNFTKIVLFLIVIHAIFLHPFLKPGMYVTHDGEAQMARFAAYKKAFMDLHIPPRWAGDLNYGYGVPVLNFYYPLPGYIATILLLLGISHETTLKILFSLAFLASPVGMFLLISRFASKKSAFLAGILYGLAPYQFLNMYVRGDIGESMALAFIPFSLFFFTVGIQKSNISFVIFGGILSSFILLSHHGIGLMIFPFIIFFTSILTIYHKKSIITPLIFISLYLGLTAFFWMPALIEHRYTLASLFIGDMYKHHFLSFQDLITKPWGFHPNTQAIDGQAPQIGITPFALLCISVILSRKKKNLFVLGLIMFFLIGLFLSMEPSTMLWEKFSILKKYQFPWRFIALATVTLPMIVGILFPLKKSFILICICLLMLFQSLFYKTNNKYIDHPENWYVNFPGTTFFHGETFTIWSDGGASSYPQSYAEVIDGEATIQNIHKKTQRINLNINAITDTTIRFNTLYYPGWKAYVNTIEKPIQFQDPNNRGIITVSVPPGKHIVWIEFTETKLRMFANGLSIISLVTALGSLLWIKKRSFFF